MKKPSRKARRGPLAFTAWAVIAIGPGSSLDAALVFRRGDANASTGVDISDAVFGLNHLFVGGPAPPCLKAADANDDGLVNIADASYLLNFLFTGGQPPPAPFPDCDPDPTADALTCTQFLQCKQPAPRDPVEYLEEVAAAGDSPELDPTCSLWEADVDGEMSTIAVCEDSGRAHRGAILIDSRGKAERLASLSFSEYSLAFTDAGPRRQYRGVVGKDLILGSWSSLTDPDFTGSWRARPATSAQGLAELGDWNGDGGANNQDVVDFVDSLGITLHTYQVCDDAGNPACFDLLAEPATTAPDGSVRTFHPDRFRDFAISPAPFPPARLPAIRNLGRSCLSFPLEVLEPATQGQGWTLSFSGVSGATGSLTGLYAGTIGSARALFLFASLRPSGRLYLDATGAWDVIEDLAVEEDRRLGVLRLTFSRRLPGGLSQRHNGVISGPAVKGVLGTRIAGTFTDGAATLRWSAEGEVRAPGAGISNLTLVHDGATGRLRLRLDEGWMGRVKISQEPVAPAELFTEHPDWWESLEQVEYQGMQLAFRRAGLDDTFTGTVVGSVLSGTFAGFACEASRMPDGDLANVEPGCRSRPEWEVGTICKLTRLAMVSSQRTCAVALAHALQSALNPPGGPPRSPFDDDALDAYNQADFAQPLAFARTVADYVTERAYLWPAARKQLTLGMPGAWRRLEFVRSRVFLDASIEGEWRVDLGTEQGILEIALDKTGEPTDLLASFTPARRPTETLFKATFNGLALKFSRPVPGSGAQGFIAELRGSSLEGLHVDGDEVRAWTAERREP